MNKANKKYTSYIALFLLLFIASVPLMLYLQNSLQDTTMILGADLYPRWVGTQAVLERENPYSQATRQQIWLEIYGSTDVPEGNLFGFYYPPAVTTLLMPFVMGGLPGRLAAALWCAVLFALLSTFLILWMSRFRNLPKSLILLPFLLISGWLFRPAFSNYLLGQFALFSSLTAIAAWYSFEMDKPIWAGIFASLSLIKPSLTILPIGYLFIKNWRDPKGTAALIASSLLLYLPPTIMLGWWLPDFLADISRYAIENRVAWSIMDMITFPGILWLLMSIMLVGLGIYKKNSLLSFGAFFSLNAIIAPHSADYDLVAFIPLLVYLGDRFLVGNKSDRFIALFFVLVWFPWISLIFVLGQTETNAIEVWYRFIWLVYPLIILLLSLMESFPTTGNITADPMESNYAG